MASKDFDDFYRSCIAYQSSEEYVDEKNLLRLKDDELKLAETLLLEAIQKKEWDDRPIKAAGYLKLSKASNILKERLSTGFKFPYLYVDAAVALWRIEKYPKSASIIINILEDGAQSQDTRENAVICLRYLSPISEVVKALIESVDDSDNSISLSALDSLFDLFKSDSQIRYLIEEIKVARGDALSNCLQKNLTSLRKLLKKRLQNSVK